MSTIFNRFYSAELAKLRSLSVAFAKANPAMAPMLAAESTDPDVERLLEGVAFLNGLTLQKLDDEFPEIAQELAAVLAPQMLRPLPAATMMMFTPKVGLRETAEIPSGTEIMSVPVDGVQCAFKTTTTIEASPLTLERCALVQGSDGRHRLTLEISTQMALPSKLRLFLGDDFGVAAEYLMLLSQHVKSVRLTDAAKQSVAIDQKITFPGLSEELIPYPDNAFPGYRLLQELLYFPQKFLFVEFSGLSKASGVLSGGRYQIEVDLGKLTGQIPVLSENSFQLNVTPAINLCSQDGEPIKLDHEAAEYSVRVQGVDNRYYQIYSIDSVLGYKQGSPDHKTYIPFSMLSYAVGKMKPSYRTSFRPAVVGDKSDVFLSVAYQKGDVPQNETLSIKLTCTNGALPESLRLGDVSLPTDSTPERFTFKNIKPVTGTVEPPRSDLLLWSVIGHASVNLLSLEDVESLRSIIRHYNFQKSQDQTARIANERQIDGIVGMRCTRETRLVRGMLVQGQHIRLEVQQANWPSLGALYLWGSVLDRFVAGYAGINSYTRFELEDPSTGVLFKWPIRLGEKPLI